ncbi:hypothetical protein TWF730_001945 [Orbilia blumenaviensis]|uniref:Uncharacterized protein n=1 Tax=Orbilia blumenaviensis TaxID=1796055 RepID=A0AAV9UG12_9PEZI
MNTVCNHDLPASTSTLDIKISHLAQPYGVKLPVRPELQPRLFNHSTLPISVFTKHFVTNYIFNIPLPWVGSQAIRLTSDSLVSHGSDPEQQYTILPAIIRSTPYLLPVLVTDDINQAIFSLGIYIPESLLKDIDGVISTTGVDSIVCITPSVRIQNKLPNFNWIKPPYGNKGMGVVLEVFSGKLDGGYVGELYCGPGSIYNEAWRAKGINGRGPTTMVAMKGVKKAMETLEMARKRHGYPVSFAAIGLNCQELLEGFEGWDEEGATTTFRKRGPWKEVFELLWVTKKRGVKIELFRLRKEREDMLKEMLGRRLSLKERVIETNRENSPLVEGSTQHALYPHSLEHKPLTSTERIITKDDVLEALPKGVLDDSTVNKDLALRRSPRQRKRHCRGKEGTGGMSLGLSSRRISNVDENTKNRTQNPESRAGHEDSGWAKGYCSTNLPNGGDSILLYKEEEADLVDAREWKRMLNMHIRTGNPLQYPWAPTDKYCSTEERNGKPIGVEDEFSERAIDPWSQFQHDVQSFQEEFGIDMSYEDEDSDEDSYSVDMSMDGLSDDSPGARLPRLYRSAGPSPESMDGIKTPPVYFRENANGVEFLKRERLELEMPELEIERTGMCEIEVPVQVEARGRNTFSRRVALYDASEAMNTKHDDTWTLEELQTIGELIEDSYEQDGDADDEGENKICLQPNTYSQRRDRSRSLSRLRRGIEDVKLGIMAIPEGHKTEKILKKGSRSPIKRLTKIPGSPVKKRRDSRSPVKRLTISSGTGKPVDRNMAFKGLSRAISDGYELIEH